MRATNLAAKIARATLTLTLAAAVVGCGGGGGDGPDLATGGGDMTLLANGCPPLTAPLATPDGGAGGDSWATYAQGFFASYCTRCHATTLTGDARNGAPDGYNWDDEATVRAHLAVIRSAVGVGNFMPPSPPQPSCVERRRIVRWLDANGP